MVRKFSDEISLKLAADILASEGLVIMPCDTIYGILGLCPETEQRISLLKGRPPEKPYIRLVGDVEDLKGLSRSSIPRGILDLLPAPLTLVVRDKAGVSAGVRVPDDKPLAELLGRLGRPLFSTSVNKRGTPPLWRISDIVREFENSVDLILDGGDHPGGVPSTVLDVTSSPCRVIRQGDFIVPKRFLET